MRGVGVGRGGANSASSAVTLLLLWLLPGVQVDFLSPSAGPQAVTSSQGPPPQVGSASAGPGPTTGQASLSSPLPCGVLRCPSQIPPQKEHGGQRAAYGRRPRAPPLPLRATFPEVAPSQGGPDPGTDSRGDKTPGHLGPGPDDPDGPFRLLTSLWGQPGLPLGLRPTSTPLARLPARACSGCAGGVGGFCLTLGRAGLPLTVALDPARFVELSRSCHRAGGSARCSAAVSP